MSDIVSVSKVIMFVDLHNFSIVTRRLGARTSEFLQAYYVLVGDLVVPDGKLIKYIGDAVLAVFDVGTELVAISKAESIRERYADLARLFEIEDITEAEIGIGSGRIDYGTFGHSSHRATDICGEAVNETAVIMHHRGVAITRSVYDVVFNIMKCNPLPDFDAKWTETPIKRWEVAGPV